MNLWTSVSQCDSTGGYDCLEIDLFDSIGLNCLVFPFLFPTLFSFPISLVFLNLLSALNI